MRALLASVRHTYSDQNVRKTALLLLTLVAVATAFYSWSEHWAWIDALYFAVTTLVTTGAGNLVPKSVAGKLFTIGYIVVGLAIFLSLVQVMAQDLWHTPRDEGDNNRPGSR